MSPLERRYRRLLALYPPAHRRQYEDEMVTVLLAGTAPGRDCPSAADSLDLLFGAVASRLRTTGGWLAGDAWRRAAPLAGYLICVLFAVRAVPVADLELTAVGGPPGWRTGLLLSAAGALVWAVLLVLARAGLRRAAATVAGVLAATAAVGTLLGWSITEQTSMSTWDLAVLAGTAAVALAVRPDRARPLGAGLGLAAVAVAVFVELLHHPPVSLLTWLLSPSAIAVAAVALALVVAVLAARRLGVEVVARIVVLLVPAAAVRLVVGPLGRVYLPGGASHQIWPALAAGAAALVAFGLGLLALAALDRVARLVQVGRLAEARATMRRDGDGAEPARDEMR